MVLGREPERGEQAAVGQCWSSMVLRVVLEAGTWKGQRWCSFIDCAPVVSRELLQ